jgi:hypothetical protein
MDLGFWRKCSSCKKPIGFKQLYWVCNVSTCNRKRTGLIFCSVACWDAHNPMMNHRDSWAEERRSPSEAEWRQEQDELRLETARAEAPAPAAKPSTPTPMRASYPSVAPSRPSEITSGAPDILIVASKLKAYVRARSRERGLEMNTSDAVMKRLSTQVRKWCDQGIDRAQAEGRKTVLDRDF